MIIDEWDLAHVAVVVDDLDAAMAMYSGAFGIQWGEVFEVPQDAVAKSDVYEPPISHAGLRAVYSRTGSSAVTSVFPFAPLELIWADPSSPAAELWGCPDGRHYVHHLCFWVKDLVAESQHLLERGFEREWYAEADGRLAAAYHRSKSSMRIELYDVAQKARLGERLAEAAAGTDGA